MINTGQGGTSRGTGPRTECTSSGRRGLNRGPGEGTQKQVIKILRVRNEGKKLENLWVKQTKAI